MSCSQYSHYAHTTHFILTFPVFLSKGLPFSFFPPDFLIPTNPECQNTEKLKTSPLAPFNVNRFQTTWPSRFPKISLPSCPFWCASQSRETSTSKNPLKSLYQMVLGINTSL